VTLGMAQPPKLLMERAVYVMEVRPDTMFVAGAFNRAAYGEAPKQCKWPLASTITHTWFHPAEAARAFWGNPGWTGVPPGGVTPQVGTG